MNHFRAYGLSVAMSVVMLAGCSSAPKSPDVTSNVRKALDQGGFKDVTSKEDRDKGVVTLGGHVPTDEAKMQAESVAKANSGALVVANEIAVVVPGAESESKKMNSALDKGIEANLDAALIQDHLRDGVKYTVKNHVVTLTGEVKSQMERAMAEKIAAAVPNVDQVVNELQVKGQKATSTM